MPTSVEAHYFVAAELVKAGVRLASMAPRFSGEFQKGIDYKGNTEVFADEFEQHFMIAEHFGYRISVHSGSDKFSVFPIIGQKTGAGFTLKPPGQINWKPFALLPLRIPRFTGKCRLCDKIIT